MVLAIAVYMYFHTGKLKARLHFMNFIGSYHSLTFKVLIKNRENNALHYISCPADNSHELSSLIFSEKKKKLEKKRSTTVITTTTDDFFFFRNFLRK